jgi:hypothetical protein
LKDNVNFAGISINRINVTEITDLLKEAKLKYNAYNPEDWTKAYFDEHSGGYIAVNKERIENSKKSKNEKAKFDKEFEMSLVFAKNGDKIELLEEIPRIPSPDVKINGILADLKRVSGHNNIVKYANRAIYQQGAELILFQFDKMDDQIIAAINALKKRNVKGMYFVTGNNRIVKF